MMVNINNRYTVLFETETDLSSYSYIHLKIGHGSYNMHIAERHPCVLHFDVKFTWESKFRQESLPN